MRKHFTKFLALATVAVTAAVVTGCSSDDEPFANYDGTKPMSRAANVTTVIDFEDFPSDQMAGPTSQGDNCMIEAGSGKTTSDITSIWNENGTFASQFNDIKGINAWSVGGVALSKWNYRSNPSSTSDISIPSDGKIPTDWWYSWRNQCSVYNTASVDGSNSNAGHSGSNFGIVYGYNDTWTNSIGEAEFYFGVAGKFVEFWYANNSYTYGVIKNGNTFGGTGTTTSLKDSKGWFKVIMYLYDEAGSLITTQEKYIADYRSGHTTVEPVETWTKWTVNVEGVQSVKFNFEGSDTNIYGLNTPAYLCIDDLKIEN